MKSKLAIEVTINWHKIICASATLIYVLADTGLI